MTSKSMCLMRQTNQKFLDKRYKNRSCLRPYLLGCNTKMYLKTDQKCLKFASSRSKSCLQMQKRPDLRIKSSQSRLFTGASNYEFNSFKKLLRIKG